jgi:hypothetical protein
VTDPDRGGAPAESGGLRDGVAAALAALPFAALASGRDDADEDALAEALALLGWTVGAGALRRAGDTLAAAGACLALATAAVLPPALPAVAVATAAGWYVPRRLPVALASARETAALGAAPVVVSHAVLRMRLEPTVERAAAFAARADDGPLGRSLAEHVRRARGTPAAGLGAWGERWGERFPALRRAASLVAAAGRATPAERARSLDRATRAILDGTRERTASAAAALRGPVTALYAFGVLLPLALVAVLPAARSAGVGLTLPVVVALYDLALPLSLAAAGGWLLLRRPATFPATPVPADHPDLPARRWPTLAGGAVAAGLAWLVATRFLPPWSPPLAAVGVGVGLALVGWFRPAVAVRERVRAVEAGLPDALYLVGRRVGEGRAVEAAIESAADEASGAVGEVLAATARRQRTLRVGVGEALYGDHGALSTLPSDRVHGTLRLLVVAAREGRPAGEALVAVADHVDRLRSVEREARRDLRRVTTTLANTAAVFGPLVGGVTVALADSMGGRSLSAPSAAGTAGSRSPPTGGADALPTVGAEAGVRASGTDAAGAAATLPTGGLALAVGVYVLLLAALLTALATGLERGGDRARAGYRVGLALPTATALYLLAYVAAGALV